MHRSLCKSRNSRIERHRFQVLKQDIQELYTLITALHVARILGVEATSMTLAILCHRSTAHSGHKLGSLVLRSLYPSCSVVTDASVEHITIHASTNAACEARLAGSTICDSLCVKIHLSFPKLNAAIRDAALFTSTPWAGIRNKLFQLRHIFSHAVNVPTQSPRIITPPSSSRLDALLSASPLYTGGSH